jgi:small subunit ribosomal protein S6
MRTRRREYELMYIVSSLRTGEDEIAAAIERVNTIITSLGGEVTRTENSTPWGRRRFAYPIREYAEGEPSRRIFNEGHYVLIQFSFATDQITELERQFKLNDSVLRYLLTTVDPKKQAAKVVPVGAVAEEESSSDDQDAEAE